MGMYVFVNAIEFSIPHVAHEANIYRALDAQSLNNGAMKIFHAEMLAVGKPMKNLHFIHFIVGSPAPSRFGKHRDLLGALEGVAGRHHYPNAVIGYQLRETIHIVGNSSYLQVFLNEYLIGLS